MTKRLLTVALIATCVALLFAVLGLRSTASASGSGDPRIAALQAQVKALQTQVKTLQTQQKTLSKAVGTALGGVDAAFAGETCLAAETADLLEGTWGVIDQLKPTFGTQTQLNDYGNCNLQNLGAPRGGVGVPPNMTALNALIAWLHE